MRLFIPRNNAWLVAACICLILVLIHFPGIWSGDYPGPFATTQTDVVFTFEPYKLSTIAGWRNGEAFWWNDQASLGAPLVLPLGVGILHPFNVLNTLAPPDLAYALGLCARLFMVLFFCYLYLRTIGVSSWIAIMAALGLTFGNWNINYAQQIIGYTMCFFPMALWAIERYAQQATSRHLLILTIALSLMILGAFPSILMYAWIVLAAYVLIRVPTFIGKLYCGFPFIVACIICAPMLLETVSYYSSVQVDMAQRRALFNYVPPLHSALTFILPSLHGGFNEHFAVYGQRDFFGTKLGAGLLVAPALTLFILAPYRRAMLKQPMFVFWAACLLLCFAIYFNFFNVRSLFEHIPLLKDHPLTRLQAFIAISGAITSALMLQHVFSAATDHTPSRWVAVAVPVSLVIIFLMILQHEPTRYMWGFAWMTVALSASLSWFWRGGLRPLAATLSILLVLVSTVYSTSIYVDRYRSESFYPSSPIIAEIQRHLAPGGRILDINDRLFNMRHAAYGVPSITGHYFTPQPLRTLIQTLGVNAGRNGLSYSTVTDFDGVRSWPLLRKLHVQFVVLPNDQARTLENNVSPDHRVRLMSDDLTLIEVLDKGQPLGAPDGFSGEGYQGFRQAYGRVQLRPTSGQPIELPIRMYPGWDVVEGGHLLPSGPLGLIRVQPTGGSAMRLEFRPALFRALLPSLSD